MTTQEIQSLWLIHRNAYKQLGDDIIARTKASFKGDAYYHFQMVTPENRLLWKDIEGVEWVLKLYKMFDEEKAQKHQDYWRSRNKRAIKMREKFRKHQEAIGKMSKAEPIDLRGTLLG